MKNIGVTIRLDDNSNKYIHQDYITFLETHALNIIPLDLDDKDFLNKLKMCDMFLVTGGEDVNPSRYGEENVSSHPYPGNIDELDYEVFKYAFSHSLRLVGICRGLQILNVYLGGTLHQDIPLHKEGSHVVRFDNFYKDVIHFRSEFSVNTFHHQGIKDLSDKLDVLCKSEDGIIEAVVTKDRNAIAVQWHPEKMDSAESEAIVDWLRG